MSIESVMLSNHLILFCPLLLLPSIFPSIKVFSNESALCIRTSASASVPPMNIQGWFPLRLIGLISLLSKGLSRVFSSTTIWNINNIKPQTPNTYAKVKTSLCFHIWNLLIVEFWMRSSKWTFKNHLSIWATLSIIGGEGNGNPFQYSCLDNPMDGGAW